MKHAAEQAGRPIRLCIVMPNHWAHRMGGAEYQMQCLVETLAADPRFEIAYLARKVPADYAPASHRAIKIGRGFRNPRLGHVSDTPMLLRALYRIRPDVVYQRVGCGYTGAAALYARLTGIPMIWHVAHDNDVMRESLRDTGNFLRRWLEKRSIEYGIRHATHIVTQSVRQAELLKRNYGRAATAVIRNFQPLPAEVIDKSAPVTVVWVSNFKRWKRPEAFVRAAARLADLPARFVMVGAEAAGSGGRGWNADVMRRIKATPNVQFLGPRSQDEVNALLARAHVFVNTSEFEGFPNTFIQAWMREVPVVSLDVDPDGVLARERIGVHADGSEERLAGALREFLTDADRRADYGRRAREYALRNHSLGNIEALARLFESSVAQGRAAVLPAEAGS